MPRTARGREATPEQVAAAEQRMSRALRRRRHPLPDPDARDPFAALDVPDTLSITLYRHLNVYAGTLSWAWRARAYSVDVLSSDGRVDHVRRTMHEPKREAVKTFELAPRSRPTVDQLLKDLSRCVWALAGGREAVPVVGYWQPPLPGL